MAWLMLVIMVIPFKYWNNAYSFAGFLLCFLLAVASGHAGSGTSGWIWPFGALDCGLWGDDPGGLAPVGLPSLSTRFLLYYVTCMLCVVVIVSTVETWRHLTRLMAFPPGPPGDIPGGTVPENSGVEVNPSYVDMNLNKGMPGRVWSFYENPNTLAEVLLLLIPPWPSPICCAARAGWAVSWAFCSAAVGCVAMAMTYSRASWVGLAFAAVVFVVLWNWKLIPFGILAALVVLAILPDTVFNRILTIFNTSDTSTSTAASPVSGGGGSSCKRPRLGAGLGSDAVRQAIGDLNLFHGKDHFVHCHNIYLQVWCETGLVGVISFVGGILWTFKKGCRAVAWPPMTRWSV